MVVMKGVRRNNLYYLKGNMVIRQVMTSVGSDDDCTRLWHMKREHTGEKSLQGLTNQDLLKGAKTCKLNFCDHCVIVKKTKVKFSTEIHCTEGIIDYIHTDI